MSEGMLKQGIAAGRLEPEQFHTLECVGVWRRTSASFISRRANHAVVSRNEVFGEIAAVLAAHSSDECGGHCQADMKKGAPMALLRSIIAVRRFTPLEELVARAESCQRQGIACRRECA